MYKIINEVLDAYTDLGISINEILNYLNKAEENFEFIYNKILSKCEINNIEIDENQLKIELKDMIIDRISFISDIQNKNI